MRYTVIIPLVVAALLMPFVGCSDRIVIVDGDDDPGLVQGGINPGDASFEIVIPTAGTAQHPLTGPFILRGDDIHYDTGIGALMVDLTIQNTSPNSYPLPISLEFITLLPPNTTILNPSNGIHGPGAMIQFEFADRDLEWTPGETSLPRSVQFGVDPGVSIGFAVRLHVGPPPDRGTISGVVWNDANENGVRDVDEPGLEGRGVMLAWADSLLDCVPPTDCLMIQHATTGPDGRYAFVGLDDGFYVLTLMRDFCSTPTTPPEIRVILVVMGGVVTDFPSGDFGVKLLMADFTRLVVREQTGSISSHAYDASDSRIYAKITPQPTSSTRDFGTGGSEYYDIFFSDADGDSSTMMPGDPLPEKPHITFVCWDGHGTVPDVAPSWNGAGNNLESVTLEFDDGTKWYAQKITSHQWGLCNDPPPNTVKPLTNILGPPDSNIIGMGGGISIVTVQMGPEDPASNKTCR